MKKIIRNTTSININNSVEGETLETKCRRIVDNKEPIKDSAPIIYTERKDGVMAGYDVRTDRFDVAIEAMNALSKANTAKRMEKLNKKSDEPSQQAATDEINK